MISFLIIWDNLKCNATLSVQRTSNKFIWNSEAEADDDDDYVSDCVDEYEGNGDCVYDNSDNL